MSSPRRLPTSAIKMAAFTAITLLLIGLLGTLIGNVSFQQSRSYSAVFTDATGVHVGDRVRLAGVEVGSVEDIHLISKGEHRYANIEFTVRKQVPVYRSARLTLRYENIIGQRYLAITESPGTGHTMAEGATFPVEQTTPALNLTVLFNGFQPLFRALKPDQVNQLSYGIIRTLQGEGGTLRHLLGNTAQLTSTLADKDAVIGRVIDNLNTVLTTVDRRDTKLTELIDNFRTLMRGLASDRETIDKSLPSLGALLRSTTGLVSEVRAPLKSGIGSLNTLAGQLSDTRHVLDEKLTRLPGKINAVSRAGSYGSWFNFYVCGLRANVFLLGRNLPLSSPSVAANERDTVCAGGQR